VIRRIVIGLLAIPVGVLLITLAVANRHAVRLVLDPFRPENPVVSAVLPFYAFLFGTLIIGVIIGGIATWIAQSHWRRAARRRSQEAARWKAEADRLTRERDQSVARERPGAGRTTSGTALAVR